jgi:hypothetical protein
MSKNIPAGSGDPPGIFLTQRKRPDILKWAKIYLQDVAILQVYV